MEQELLVAIFAGLGGMLGWGLADFFAKKTIDQIGDVSSLAWGHIFGTIALILMAVYQTSIIGNQFEIPNRLIVWLGIAGFGISQAAVYLFVYQGFGKGQVGVLSPIFASFSGITAILSIVIFKESLRSHTLLGMAILFLGIILINMDIGALRERRFSFSHIPGFKEVAFATFLASLWTLFWGRFLEGQNWLSYTLFMYAFMTLAILVVAKIKKTNMLGGMPSSMWKFLALIGVCETGAYLSVSLGYSATSIISVVALLSGAFSLPTIILARMFLKEKISGLQTFGGLVIIAGIMILSII